MIRTGRGDGGQATVELALVLPLVAALVLVALQVGLVLRDHVLVTHAAREAARAAAVAEAGERSAAAQRGAQRSGSLDEAQLAVTTSSVDGGEAVRVEVRYRSTTDVPLVGPVLPDVVLRGDATMRIEARRSTG